MSVCCGYQCLKGGMTEGGCRGRQGLEKTEATESTYQTLSSLCKQTSQLPHPPTIHSLGPTKAYAAGLEAVR